jgi:hypothetical protein
MTQWTQLERQNFQMFFEQINHIVLSIKWTLAEKIVQVGKIIRFYEAQESRMEQQLLRVHVDDNLGSLNQLCKCVGF